MHANDSQETTQAGRGRFVRWLRRGRRWPVAVAAAALLVGGSGVSYTLWPELAGEVAADPLPVGLPLLGATTTPIGGDSDRGAARGSERSMVSLVNTFRARRGCGAVHWDSRLAAAAGRHSADMARRDYFDHASPDGETPWDRARAAGYPNAGGENIAAGSATFDATLQQWIKSPGHRANLLNCKFVAMGVGEAEGGPMAHYWTQMFGYV